MQLAIQRKAYRKRRFNTRFEIKTQLRMRDNLEKGFYRSLKKELVNNGKRVSKELENALDFNSDINTIRLFNTLYPVIQKNLRKVFQTFIEYNISLYDPDQKDLEFTTFGQQVTFEQLFKEYLRERNIIFETLSANQSKQITRVIRQLRSQNLTLPQISKQVQQSVGNFSAMRAARIARTETHSAANFASQAYNKKISEQLGETLYKKWVSVGDERTRSSHALANGQVRPLDDDFDINGAQMKYPGDPRGGAKNVVNCRCVVVYVDEEDLGNVTGDSQLVDRDPVDQTSPYRFPSDNPIVNSTNDVVFLDAPKNVQDAIRNVGPISEITSEGMSGLSTGAYYFPFNKSLNMPKSYGKPNNPRYKVVYSHEYGHHLDFVVAKFVSMNITTQTKFRKFVKKNDITDAELDDIFNLRVISGLGIKKHFSKDRKNLTKTNKDNLKLMVQDRATTEKVLKDLGINSRMERVVSQYSGMTRDMPVRKFIIPFEEAEQRLINYLKNGTVTYQDLQVIHGKNFFKKIYAGDASVGGIDAGFLQMVNSSRYRVFNPTGKNPFDFYTSLMSEQMRAELVNFNDFIGSLTNAKIYTGHGSKYYSRKKFETLRGWSAPMTTEMMANYTSLMTSTNREFWRKHLREIAPESLDFFDELFELIGNTEGGFN